MGIDSVLWIVGGAAALVFALMFFPRQTKERRTPAPNAVQQHNAEVGVQSAYAAQADLNLGSRKARNDDWKDATDSDGGGDGGGD